MPIKTDINQKLTKLQAHINSFTKRTDSTSEIEKARRILKHQDVAPFLLSWQDVIYRADYHGFDFTKMSREDAFDILQAALSRSCEISWEILDGFIDNFYMEK